VTKKSLQLTQRQTRMLADMGIDVWYPRKVTTAAANQQHPAGVSSQPIAAADLASLKSTLDPAPLIEATPVAQPAAAPEDESARHRVAPIRLYHLHNEAGLLISAAPLSGPVAQFAADLLLSQRWRQGTATNAKPEFGEFNWPLTDNVGTPERALHAFMDKFGVGAKDGRILFCTEATRALITSWVTLADQSYLLIPDLSELMLSADAKRQFWDALCRHR
jgi:hypothetical protein